LSVDREYREKAEAGKLRRIAPRRFNPDNIEWLPIFHTERGEWQFTALYSNTALAHELGRTQDWVVLYFHADSHVEDQRTVVTETQGPLKGRRVVRGRERECEDYYNLQPDAELALRPFESSPAMTL
jgi:putative hydrolase